MGEIADDCYDRALDEMEDRDAGDPFFGCGEQPSYHRPLRSRSLNLGMQHVGRSQRQLPLEMAPNRDWMFVTIENNWPFNSHNFKVIQPDLKAAVKDFYENEWHKPFRHDKTVPDYHIDVQPQTTGGWIVYGETQTVLIFCR